MRTTTDSRGELVIQDDKLEDGQSLFPPRELSWGWQVLSEADDYAERIEKWTGIGMATWQFKARILEGEEEYLTVFRLRDRLRNVLILIRFVAGILFAVAAFITFWVIKISLSDFSSL